MPRGYQIKGRKDDGSVYELKMEPVYQHIKAVISFHAVQFSRSLSREASIHGIAPRAWLKNRRNGEWQRKRESYEDHARYAAQDG